MRRPLISTGVNVTDTRKSPAIPGFSMMLVEL